MIIKDSSIIQELVRYLSNASSLEAFRDATVELGLVEKGAPGSGNPLLAAIEARYFEFSLGSLSEGELRRELFEVARSAVLSATTPPRATVRLDNEPSGARSNPTGGMVWEPEGQYA